jgi:hypothetical protein
LTSSTDIGGSPILSYSLEWDQGSGLNNFYDLVGAQSDYPSNSFNVTSNISPGVSYRFRVRAKNRWAWSSYSSIITAIPSAEPSQMAAVVTSVNTTSGWFVVTWTAPNNNSAAITKYKIEFNDRQGTTWTEQSVYCDG